MLSNSNLARLSPEVLERVRPHLGNDEEVLDVIDRNVSFLQSTAGRSIIAYTVVVLSSLVVASLVVASITAKFSLLQILSSRPGVFLVIALCVFWLSIYSKWDSLTKKYLLITSRQVIAVDLKPIAGLPAVKTFDLGKIRSVSASRFTSRLVLRGGPRLFCWRHFIVDFEDPDAVVEKIKLRQTQMQRISKLG